MLNCAGCFAMNLARFMYLHGGRLPYMRMDVNYFAQQQGLGGDGGRENPGWGSGRTTIVSSTSAASDIPQAILKILTDDIGKMTLPEKYNIMFYRDKHVGATFSNDNNDTGYEFGSGICMCHHTYTNTRRPSCGGEGGSRCGGPSCGGPNCGIFGNAAVKNIIIDAM